jgi:acyl-CoA synthetase (AMP-forming)/AMP-acid ligase II/thioesterase domain-containing protein
MPPSNLYDLIRAQAERAPDAPALLAPGRVPLTYAGLLAQMRATLARLNALGLGRGDRVALALPTSPELAAAFLGTAAAAIGVPLNPAYTAAEFDHYLRDLRVRAVIVEPGTASPAAAVARALGLALIELQLQLDAPAGTFELQGPPAPLTAPPGPAGADDVALLLHTSGTTGLPKRAPRRHAELIAGALDYHPALGLTPADRCLSIMPLFHIQGLVSALLTPLSGGASVVVAPGFNPDHFFEWLQTYQPTWFTASPALLQVLLELAQAQPMTFPAPGLRFIRSGGAPLPAALQAELERVFQVPVLVGYGLSEVVPIASSPLPPRPRKPGSVGVLAGPQVRIARLDPASGALDPAAPGQRGEIVVRGPSVMRAYDGDPAANAEAFVGGWFRTGDEGYLDEDGYLFLTGRLKEMINHGGEKVAPAEVEAALRAHPDVAEAAAFAMPDAVYGEAVAAAVVIRPGAAFDTQALRRVAAARLAAFKVPRRIIVVDALPRGPTGKVLRRRLAEQLQAADALSPPAPAYAPPIDDLERRLAQLWSGLFGGARIGRHDNFFDLGGHSLLAGGLLTQLEAEVGRPLPTSLLAEAPTLAQLADRLRRPAPAAPPGCLVRLQPHGSRPPFFCVHDLGGDVLAFAELARLLNPDRPFYGVEAVGLRDDQAPHREVEAMAACYVAAVRHIQPHGPYFVGGYCFGGVVSYEMARQLAAAGEPVALVAVFEGFAPTVLGSPRPRWTRERLAQFAANLPGWLEDYRALGLAHAWRRARHVGRQLARQAGRRLGIGQPLRLDEIVASAEALPPRRQAVMAAHLAASRAYRPGPYPGRVTLFNVRHQSLLLDPDPRRGWQRLAGEVAIQRVDGSHHTILQPPHVASLARALRASLEGHPPPAVPGALPELQTA